MARDIRTNLIADDQGTPAFKSYANSAEAAASMLDGLSDSQRKLAIEAEKASIRVERATRALTNAQNRYGESSHQARDATLKLLEAENNARITQGAFKRAMESAADAADDLGDELNDVAAAQNRVSRGSISLRSGLDRANGAFKSTMAGAVALGLGLGKAAAGGSALVAVSASLLGQVLPVALAIGKATSAAARLAPAYAPALATLPAFAAAFFLVKTALVGSGPQLAEAFTPLGKKLAAARDLTGDIAARHVPALARAFAQANLPGIETFFRRIGHAEQYVIDQILKWSATAPGQETIRRILGATAGFTEHLSKILPPVVTAFAEMAGRAAGPGFSELGKSGGALDRLAKGAEHLFDSVSGKDVGEAIKRIEGLGTGIIAVGEDVRDAGRWLDENKGKIKLWADGAAGASLVFGIMTGSVIPALIGGLTLLAHHWDDVKGAADGVVSSSKKLDAEHGISAGATKALSGVVSGLVGWYQEYLAPSMSWLAKSVMPSLRAAGDDLMDAFHSLSKDSAFWTGLLKVLGGIIIGVIIGAISVLAITIQGVAKVIQIAASYTHGFIGAFMDLRNGAEDAGTKLHNWFHDLPGRISAALGEVGSLLLGKGGDLVSGLFRGSIAAMTSGLSSWVSQIKDSIVGATKRAFGISSPSKVFAQLGGHMMDGLVVGIIRNNPTSMIQKVFGGTTAALSNMVSSGLIGAGNLTKKALGALGGMFGIGGDAPGGGNTSNRSLGKLMAQSFGWTGNQWSALDRLWMGESGWNASAKNPTSTAFGIPQFLKSTAGAYGLAYGSTNPAAQISAGLRYIQDVYGSPAAAYGAWSSRSPHWYDEGGLARGKGVMFKNVNQPERVLSPFQTKRFDRMVSVLDRGRGALGNVIVQVSLPNYVGSRDEIRNTIVDAFSTGRLDIILNRVATGRR